MSNCWNVKGKIPSTASFRGGGRGRIKICTNGLMYEPWGSQNLGGLWGFLLSFLFWNVGYGENMVARCISSHPTCSNNFETETNFRIIIKNIKKLICTSIKTLLFLIVNVMCTLLDIVKLYYLNNNFWNEFYHNILFLRCFGDCIEVFAGAEPLSSSYSPLLILSQMLIQYFNPKRHIFQNRHLSERTGVLFT